MTCEIHLLTVVCLQNQTVEDTVSWNLEKVLAGKDKFSKALSATLANRRSEYVYIFLPGAGDHCISTKPLTLVKQFPLAADGSINKIFYVLPQESGETGSQWVYFSLKDALESVNGEGVTPWKLRLKWVPSADQSRINLVDRVG